MTRRASPASPFSGTRARTSTSNTSAFPPARRGQGLGTAALDLFAKAGKPAILEIDPPVDAVSRRRQTFYERAGFFANPHPHIHPPYRPENSGHALVVMSRPRPLTKGEYAAFAAYLADVVMKDCQKP